MFLFRGIAAILFGVPTLVWPKLSLAVLVFLFGLFAVISGITAIAAALRNRGEQGWGLLLFEGILGIVALAWFHRLVLVKRGPVSQLAGHVDLHVAGCDGG
jgi:uncharacterized membrane protein HdeD (DUF308 family)